MTFTCCAVIPSYNHGAAVTGIIAALRRASLPVFLIDDGSDEPTRRTLAALASPDRDVHVKRMAVNRGKGAAVMQGFKLAAAAGFSHVLQIDADGQHDLAALPELLRLGAAQQEAVVVGHPVYDRSIPRGRRIARYGTHIWVGIETLTLHPVDCMCGFRIYPLDAVLGLRSVGSLGKHMEFDIEILVRLIWAGTPVFTIPVRVTYPPGNVSNFALVRDNWRITKMHSRLIFDMLGQLPSILRNRRRHHQASAHWTSMAERGAYWGILALALVYRLAGRRGCMAMVFPIVLYFYLTGATQRRASRVFLRYAFAAKGQDREPSWAEGLRHAFNFARRTVDTFAAWVGGIGPDQVIDADPDALVTARASPQGMLLIVSHLGNIDISRTSLTETLRRRIKLLVHTKHAKNFVRILRRFRPEAAIDMIEVTDINPGTMIALKDAIDQGGWIAIAGDRTPVQGDRRVSMAPFLGHAAPFPQGPYVLAHLLECPVYLMFCMRGADHYELYFERFAECISLPRQGRETAIAQWTARYAARLESYCLKDPFQWYNFYDFWAPPVVQRTGVS